MKKKSNICLSLFLALMMVFTMVSLGLVMPQTVQAVENGHVYSFGYGGEGETGHGARYDTKLIPTRIENLDGVKTVAAGGSHSLVLLENGDVYSFGQGSYGQLGHGDKERKLVPTKIEGIGPAKSVAAGSSHSLIVLENGDVYTFGSNGWGKLGHGDTEERVTPTKVAGLSSAKAAAAGQDHSLVLLENGDVYGFGSHNSGQLGIGEGVAASHYTPEKITGIGKVKAIAAGSIHSLVVMENGDVYSFGHNRYGRLGIDYPPGPTRHQTPTKTVGISGAKEAAAGAGHSLVLLDNGDVYSFGQGSYGQLGHGDTEDKLIPHKIEGLSGVSAIAAGTRHSLAVLNNGDVYSFGHGSGGRLGQGDTNQRNIPTRIENISGKKAVAVAGGYSHSLVLVGETDQVKTPLSVSMGVDRINSSTLRLEAASSGGTNVRYRFDMRVMDSGEEYTTIRDYSSDSSYNWTDANEGVIYELVVHAESDDDYRGYYVVFGNTDPSAVTPLTGLNITVTSIGNEVHVTSAAQGGTNVIYALQFREIGGEYNPLDPSNPYQASPYFSIPLNSGQYEIVVHAIDMAGGSIVYQGAYEYFIHETQ